jgi:hypothetical protein
MEANEEPHTEVWRFPKLETQMVEVEARYQAAQTPRSSIWCENDVGKRDFTEVEAECLS